MYLTKCLWLSLIVLVAMLFDASTSTQAVTFLADDFSEPNGTPLNGKPADIGGPWNQTGGPPLTVQGGEIDTTGAGRTVFGQFTDVLSAGQSIVVEFDTNDVPGNNFHSGGFAGFSLFEGAAERVFFGDAGNATTTWGVDGPSFSANNSAVGGADQDNGRFSYNFDTGAYRLLLDNAEVASGTIGTGFVVDRLRFINGGGGDIAIDQVNVDVLSNNLIFADNFSDPNGTVLNGKVPDVGVVWNQTGGPPVIVQDGAVDTTGAGRTFFGELGSTLGAGQLFVLDFDTDDVPGNNFHTNGFAGISLFEGGTERVFIGDVGDPSSTWGIEESGVGRIISAISGANQDDGQFIYNFDTGAFTLSFDDVIALSGSIAPGIAADRIRLINGGGGDIKLNEIAVTFAPAANVPEPATALLLGMASVGLLRRRRPIVK